MENRMQRVIKFDHNIDLDNQRDETWQEYQEAFNRQKLERDQEKRKLIIKEMDVINAKTQKLLADNKYYFLELKKFYIEHGALSQPNLDAYTNGKDRQANLN